MIDTTNQHKHSAIDKKYNNLEPEFETVLTFIISRKFDCKGMAPTKFVRFIPIFNKVFLLPVSYNENTVIIWPCFLFA